MGFTNYSKGSNSMADDPVETLCTKMQKKFLSLKLRRLRVMQNRIPLGNLNNAEWVS